MSTSLVHQELPGPSVTWEFFFERQEDGEWMVIMEGTAKRRTEE